MTKGERAPLRRGGALSPRRVLIAVAIGLAAGFLAGLFGVGGGVLIVPALVIVLGVGQRLAHGTSLAAIVPIAVVGVVGYGRSGSVDWAAAVVLAGAAAVGAVIGTRWLHRLSQRLLRLVFLVFLLATALSLFRGVGSGTAGTSLDVAAVVGLGAIGLVAGLIAGLLGVGGGLVMVPALSSCCPCLSPWRRAPRSPSSSPPPSWARCATCGHATPISPPPRSSA
jgi:uncharacterized membrane protein YfcA